VGADLGGGEGATLMSKTEDLAALELLSLVWAP
jgi:hypothetical protein